MVLRIAQQVDASAVSVRFNCDRGGGQAASKHMVSEGHALHPIVTGARGSSPILHLLRDP
jgi:hypothetical protein